VEPRRLSAPWRRPNRLHPLEPELDDVWIAGEIDDDAPTIAIVGSRDAADASVAFARKLAAAIAATGTVVLSGGATGIDAAAHRGALDARGRTWCIAPTGHLRTYPPDHKGLFKEIVRRRGAMLWPFPPPSSHGVRGCFAKRNGVLVAMADAVVIIQAGVPSGTLNTAAWCRKLGRPLHVVGVSPWAKGFDGSKILLESGARPLVSIDGFLVSVGLTKKKRADARVVYGLPKPMREHLTPDEKTVLTALGNVAIHMDEVVLKTALATSAVSTALLTLALENVVVEGPAGFFRRANTAQMLNIPIDIVSSSQRHLDG
jgi:DNA processing protein